MSNSTVNCHENVSVYNLQRKIIFIGLLVSLAPLILLGGTIYYQFTRMCKDKVEEQMRYLAKAQAEAVGVFLKERVTLLNTLAFTHTFSPDAFCAIVKSAQVGKTSDAYIVNEAGSTRRNPSPILVVLASCFFLTKPRDCFLF